MKKLRVGILFGGRYGEHEISLLSAASVFKAIDKEKFEVVPIGITKEGRWVTSGEAERLLSGNPVCAAYDWQSWLIPNLLASSQCTKLAADGELSRSTLLRRASRLELPSAKQPWLALSARIGHPGSSSGDCATFHGHLRSLVCRRAIASMPSIHAISPERVHRRAVDDDREGAQSWKKARRPKARKLWSRPSINDLVGGHRP